MPKEQKNKKTFFSLLFQTEARVHTRVYTASRYVMKTTTKLKGPMECVKKTRKQKVQREKRQQDLNVQGCVKKQQI